MTYKHEIKVRVYFQDTDAYGIVYHANYLDFAERGRMEYSRSLDKSFVHILKNLKLATVARHVSVDYFASARIDDEIQLVTWVAEVKNSSYIMQTDMYLKNKLISSVRMVLVVINEDHQPVRIPEEMIGLLGGEMALI